MIYVENLPKFVDDVLLGHIFSKYNLERIKLNHTFAQFDWAIQCQRIVPANFLYVLIKVRYKSLLSLQHFLNVPYI